MTHTRSFQIGDPSAVAEARRETARLTTRLAFGATAASAVAIAVTELATNLLKHAGRGALLVQEVAEGSRRGLDLVALDRGPGMASVASAMRDGFSTAGSAGTGLGALARLSEGLDIHSVPGGGTAIACRLWAEPIEAGRSRPAVEIAGLAVAVAGESVSGDAWAHLDRPAGARILVADGLGHGADAAQASRRATEIFAEHPALAPADMVERLHAGLRDTRGAAVGVAELDLEQGTVCFAGVGNIAGSIVGPGSAHSMVSHNGTAGHEARRIAEFSYAFPPGGLLVLHSDGVSARWDLGAYPGLGARHPALVAGVLFRDFRRERDDAAVVVARAARGEARA